MAVYEVFTQPIYFKYKSTFCSKSTVFLVISNFLLVFLPLLVAYRSNEFWLKAKSYKEQPMVRFKYEYLVYMETSELHQPVICTTVHGWREHTEKYNLCSIIKTREEDSNRDGQMDQLNLQIEVTVPIHLAIYSVQLILVFDYKLQKQCLLQMETLGIIQHSSGLPVSRLQVDGDLKLVQKELLHSRGKHLGYNKTIFDTVRSPDINNIIREYAKRNVSTTIQNMYWVWTRGEASSGSFYLDVNIHYPQDEISYRPGFWQVIKWAWIQYLAVLVIFHGIINFVKNYVFVNRLVPTVKEVPWKKLL